MSMFLTLGISITPTRIDLLGTLASPAGLTATAQSGTAINLAWTDNATGEDGYAIERSLNGSTGWAEIARIATSNLESYQDTWLTPETAYYYRVRAYHGEDYSDYSDTANDTTEAITTVNEIALDTFTDTNNTSLDAHSMDTGSGWTEHSGTWVTYSNTLVQTTNPSANAAYLATIDAGKADGVISSQFRTNGNNTYIYASSIVVRYSDANNFYMVQLVTSGTPEFRILKIEGGSGTTLDTVTWIPQYEKEIEVKVECDGNTITAWVDGGFEITATNAFNNTATRFGLRESRGSSNGWNGWTWDNFQFIDLPSYPIARYGTVISEAGTDEQQNAQEATVIYDDNPQILTGDYVFKMWYTHGYLTPYINYAESADGQTWTKHGSNPLIEDHQHAHVLKDSGTYYFYGILVPDRNQIDLYTSSDGVSWSLDTSNVLAQGGVGTWDASDFGNVFVWKEGTSDWRMIYEARGASNQWGLGYATSSDGQSWTKSVSNPVLLETGMVGGSFVQKVGSTYYLWVHRSKTGTTPTQIARYSSTNLTSWSYEPYAVIIPRVGVDEGENSYSGQVADPSIVEKDGTAYIFFEVTSDGNSAAGHMHIVLATADANVISGW